VEYVYNTEGIRVQQITGGVITKYLIDPSNHTGYAQVLEEWTDDTLTMTYTIGDDVIAQNNSSGVRFLLYDGHGSVRQHANVGGNVAVYQHQYDPGTGTITADYNSFDYDAYGVALTPLPGEKGLYYSGEYFDDQVQQYYLRARFYDQANGRFTTMDSFVGNDSDPQSLHKYLYCHANPINGIDPSGNVMIGGFSISGLMLGISIGAMLTVTGLTVYNGIRHGLGIASIAWQVIQNLSVFACIVGAMFLGGLLAIAATITLFITFISSIISLVKNWPSMDTTDKVIVGVTFLCFLAFGGALRTAVPPAPVIELGQTVSPLPESYFSKFTVDMRGAPGGRTNAAGYPRNSVWFWEQVRNSRPEYFSEGNLERIQATSPRSPVVDEQWIKYHPQHQSFKGETLVHHHIGRGPIATAVPETIHQSWTSSLH
jgi:RHS repeat-associated protein